MTDDERPNVRPVLRNIGDEFRLMGVPLSEFVVLLGVPLVLWVMLRVTRLDAPIPFPAVGPIMLSSFVLWVIGPLAGIIFVIYKKAHPEYDLVGQVIYALFPRAYHTGRDTDYRPYLTDAMPRAEEAGEATLPRIRRGGPS